jgi:hypothetical protein
VRQEREAFEREEGLEPLSALSTPSLAPLFAVVNEPEEWKILLFYKVPPSHGRKDYTTLRQGRAPDKYNQKKKELEGGWGWRKIEIKHPRATMQKIEEILAHPKEVKIEGETYVYTLVENYNDEPFCIPEFGCVLEITFTEWRVPVNRRTEPGDNQEAGVITAYPTKKTEIVPVPEL